MNEYFLLYLFTRLEALNFIFAFLTLCGGIAAIFVAMATLTGDVESKVPQQICVAAIVIGALGLLVFPTRQDVAIILGGKMAIDIARSEEVSDVSKKILQAINKKLDEAAK